MVRFAPRNDHVIYAGQGSLDNGPERSLRNFQETRRHRRDRREARARPRNSQQNRRRAASAARLPASRANTRATKPTKSRSPEKAAATTADAPGIKRRRTQCHLHQQLAPRRSAYVILARWCLSSAFSRSRSYTSATPHHAAAAILSMAAIHIRVNSAGAQRFVILLTASLRGPRRADTCAERRARRWQSVVPAG